MGSLFFALKMSIKTNDIHRWLRNPKDYMEGFRILEHCKPKHPLLFILRKGDTVYNRQVLVKNLRELSEDFPEVQQVSKPYEPKPKKVFIEYDFSKLPPPLQASLKRSGAILSEVNHLKGSLHHLTQKQRIPIINKIMDLFRERQLIWTKIDHFFNPPAVKEEPVKKRSMKEDEADLNRQIKRLTDLIYRNKNKASRAIDVLEWKRKVQYLKTLKQAEKC
jgi:hypothetical protein